MYARTVTIDGTEFVVFCTPATPYSEVLRRAASIAEMEECEEPEMVRDFYGHEPFPENFSA